VSFLAAVNLYRVQVERVEGIYFRNHYANAIIETPSTMECKVSPAGPHTVELFNINSHIMLRMHRCAPRCLSQHLVQDREIPLHFKGTDRRENVISRKELSRGYKLIALT
jgi:hypothetical protein